MALEQALAKYFNWPPHPYNLPIRLQPLTGRNTGRAQLAHVLNDLGFRTGVEIGVASGRSAQMWCEAISELQLVAIDPYSGRASEKRQKNAESRSEQYGFQLWKIPSMEAVDKFEDESLDFVHIDGNHCFDFVVQDIVRWAPKVKKGGLVICHDYCTVMLGGVVKAVDAYTHCHRIDPWYVTYDYNPIAFWEKGTERA